MNFKSFYFIIVVFASLLFVFNGCNKQQEKPQVQQQTQPEVKTAPDTSSQIPKETEMEESVDLVGTWTGTFDKRATTLKIKNQKENEFSGSITINYREVINQQVSGKIDFEKMTVSMKDMLHSRFAGKYNAKLSEDMKNLSGSFTMNLDGTKVTFNLTKKQ